MTEELKNQMERLRKCGMGYRTISKTLEIPLGTVTSFFNRKAKKEKETFCMNCGLKLKQTIGHRQKKFCSEECRRHWWKKHPESHKNLKAYYRKTCVFCGNMFTSYGHKNRRFCCRECYLKFIRGEPINYDG